MTIPSRVFFGTITAFWANNFVPYVSTFWIPRSKNPDAQICRLGIEKANPKLGADFWNGVKADYDRCVEDESKVLITSSKKKRLLLDPTKDIGLTRLLAILKDESVNSIIKNYFGAPFYLTEVNAWRNFPAPEAEYAYSNFWHQDEVPYTALRVFCYLSRQVDKDNGATRVATISDSKRAIRKFDFVHTSINGKRTTLKFPYVYLDGDFGDVFVFSPSQCLHAATAISTNRPRDLLELHVDVRKGSSKDLNVLVA
jgi:hypothetical protein